MPSASVLILPTADANSKIHLTYALVLMAHKGQSLGAQSRTPDVTLKVMVENLKGKGGKARATICLREP